MFGSFLGKVGQYVELKGEITKIFLREIHYKRKLPRGFEIRHPHCMFLALISPPILKLWPSEKVMGEIAGGYVMLGRTVNSCDKYRILLTIIDIALD